MLDETLIVWATEFGRTPFEEANREVKIGRGHHHRGFTFGWPAADSGGLSYGGTDDLGMNAIHNAVHVHDIHATILYLLGLDHLQLTLHNSRDVRLTDVFGNVSTTLCLEREADVELSCAAGGPHLSRPSGLPVRFGYN